jgi:hypothetical protein
MPIDGGVDDLPRTLRRAREERMREAEAEQAALQQPSLSSSPSQGGQAGFHSHVDPLPVAPRSFAEHPEAVTVDAIKVPFLRLVLFFIKAAFAAIPALILLGMMLWGIGKGLQTFLPGSILIQTTIYPGVPANPPTKPR